MIILGLISTSSFTMFCKSLTMRTHFRKLLLALSSVLWPGSKSTSCDDTGGPSVESLCEVERLSGEMMLHDNALH